MCPEQARYKLPDDEQATTKTTYQRNANDGILYGILYLKLSNAVTALPSRAARQEHRTHPVSTLDLS